VPTIKDCVLFEIAARRGIIPRPQLDKARKVQEELEQKGKHKPLGAVLIDGELAPREAVTALAVAATACTVRCQGCTTFTEVSRANVHGMLECKRCGKKIAYEYGRLGRNSLDAPSVAVRKALEPASGPKEKGAAPRPTGTTSKPSPAERPEKGRRSEPEEAPSPTAEDPILTLGRVHKFHLKDIIGISPSGSLHRAVDGGETVAIKILDKALCASSPTFRKWIEYQHRAQDLPRTATLKPIQHFREGSLNCLRRPYLTGNSTSLAKLLEPGGGLWTANVAKDYMGAILDSLAEFHAAGLVHGNLKPSNVILSSESACLTDAGLLILLEGLAPEERGLRRLESARYQAPELLAGAEDSFSSDVFAAGRILEDLLMKVSEPDAPAAAQLRRVATWWTSNAASERPANAMEAHRGLTDGPPRRFLAPKPTKAPALQPIEPKPDPKIGRRTKALYVTGHVLLAAVVGYIGFELVGGMQARKAYASSRRADDLATRVIEEDIAELAREQDPARASTPELARFRSEMRTLLAGTSWEGRATWPSAAAAAREETPASTSTAPLKGVNSALADQDWIGALEALLALYPSLDVPAEAEELRARALDGILASEHMVIVPGPEPFLVDVVLFRRRGAQAPRGDGAGGYAALSISLVDAQTLATVSRKRLLTSAEWDRLAAARSAREPAWAAQYLAKVQDIRGPIFEWVSDGVVDALWERGYGYCRGGNRPGIPSSQAVRRMRTESGLDVGVRFARSLRPGTTDR